MVVSPHSVIIYYTICFRTCPGQLTLGQSCTGHEGKETKAWDQRWQWVESWNQGWMRFYWRHRSNLNFHSLRVIVLEKWTLEGSRSSWCAEEEGPGHHVECQHGNGINCIVWDEYISPVFPPQNDLDFTLVAPTIGCIHWSVPTALC